MQIMNFSHFQPLLFSRPFKGDYIEYHSTQIKQKQPRCFLGELAGGVLSQIYTEVGAEGRPIGVGWAQDLPHVAS